MPGPVASRAETEPGEAGGRLAWWEWVVGVIVCLLPCGLLLEPGANFYYDWHNHQWLIGYFGEHLRVYQQSPDVLHPAGAVGMPQPIFYGFLFYPGIGTMAALVGASLAIRLAVGLVLAAQLAAVHLAGRRLGAPRGVSLAVAATVTWSVHGLTNLYNRAALTEFFAVALLTTAVACAVLAIAGATSRRGRRAAGWLAVGFAVLAAGTHPPTALVGLGLIVGLGPIGWIACRRREEGARLARGVVMAAALGLVTLSPWIYANLRLQGELGIVGKYRDFSFSRDHIDAAWARFSPVPPDLFWAKTGTPGETPYVEAPLQMALLVIGGWNLYLLWRQRGRRRPGGGEAGGEAALRWLAVLGVGWFALLLTLSLSPGVAAGFRFLAPYVQFATRFVSHANLGLLVAVLATGGLVAGRGGYGECRRGTAWVAVLAIALAGVAAGLKLAHGARVRERGGEPQYAWRGDRSALVTAGKADAAGDYAVLRRLPQLTPQTVAGARRVALPVGAHGAEFGRVGEAQVTLLAEGWVITNVVAYPWSHVVVDGHEVPRELQAAHDYRVALRLPPGAHRLAWVWRPDPVWQASQVAARWSGWILLLVSAGFAARALSETRQARVAARVGT